MHHARRHWHARAFADGDVVDAHAVLLVYATEMDEPTGTIRLLRFDGLRQRKRARLIDLIILAKIEGCVTARLAVIGIQCLSGERGICATSGLRLQRSAIYLQTVAPSLNRFSNFVARSTTQGSTRHKAVSASGKDWQLSV